MQASYTPKSTSPTLVTTAPALSNRRLYLAAAAVVVAYLALVVGWAARPMYDSVPVGTDWSPTVLTPPKGQQLVSVEVTCASLFSGDTIGAPLPTLQQQPEGRSPLTFERPPCELVLSDARNIFVLNTVVALGLLGGIGYMLWRRRTVVTASG